MHVPGALACGFCIEDKVAATYDHTVVTRALDRGQDVLFLEIDQTEPASKEHWRYLVAVVKATAGVQRDSIRTSLAPATLSFAWNRSSGSPAAALPRINKALEKRQLKLVLIRVLSDSASVAARPVSSLTSRRN